MAAQMALAASAVLLPEGPPIEPGDMWAGDIRVRNTQDTADRFTLNVIGDAAPWVTVSPSALSLGAGEEGVSRLFFRPPLAARVAAGDRSYQVRVRSDLDPGRPLLAAGSVTVRPFFDMAAELAPTTAHGRGLARYRVFVNNRGNASVRTGLRLEDPSGRLALTGGTPTVEVGPGARVPTEVEVRCGRRRLLGAPKDRAFSVVVEPDGLAPIRLDGRFVQEATVGGRIVPVMVVVLALVATAVVVGILAAPAGRRTRRASAPAGAVTALPACPGAGHQAHDSNGQGPDTGLEPDNYSFLSLAPGGCRPLRFNPCQPIHYVFNQAAATPADVADARRAIAAVARATGMTFVFDGITTETGAGRRGGYEPALYPRRWAPVLIEWVHMGGGNGRTEVAGAGRPFSDDGVYVSGLIEVNSDTRLASTASLPNGFGMGVTEGRVLLHELGHLVGLGHVAGFDEIMHEPLTDQTAIPSLYGAGDLSGLRYVGRSAGCLATPPVPAGPSSSAP